MKRIALYLFLCLAASSLTRVAQADTLTFENTTLANGATVTGTIDVSGGAITGSDITVTLSRDSFTFTGAGVPVQGLLNYSDFIGSGGATLDLALPVSSMMGYNGGNVCSLANQCQTIIPFVYMESSFKAGLLAPTIDFSAGTLSNAPEPSSFVLLGTGILGAAGAARRRFLAA